MTAPQDAIAIDQAPVTQAAEAARQDEMIYRHGRIVRITHWLNAFAVIALLITGLGLTQLHKPLYWGDAGQDWGDVGQEINGSPGDPHPAIARAPEFPGKLREHGVPMAEKVGLGGWLNGFFWDAQTYLQTAPRARDHMIFAWLFLFNGLFYVIGGFWSGRFRTILRPSWSELSWRRIGSEIWHHMRLRFPHGEEARSYNLIQKYTYLTMIFIVLPLQILSGLALFPWMDAAFPWYKDLFTGRQSARTIHFGCSLLILGFLIVHLAMVVLSGFWNNIRSMITGWYRLPR